MKTFKLVSLQVVEDDKIWDVELVDGLIINKEDEKQFWLIEVFTTPSYQDYFEKALQDQREFIIRAVISKKDNDPASFHIRVCSVKGFESNVSIMLEGTLKRNSRRSYAESLLQELVGKGLSGEVLLDEFKDKMKNKPYLSVAEKVTSTGKK